MPEYTLVSGVVLLVALMAASAAGVLRRPSVWLGMIVFAVLTVVADVILTRLGVYGHGPQFNAGIVIGRMPIEDLLYGIALYLVAVSSWSWGGKHAE